jgi:hypothetical protein
MTAPWWPVQPLATVAAVILASVGLAQVSRRRNASLLAVIAILAVLVAHQGLVARDPWSGHTGHTWNVFKAVQWAFPVTFVLQTAGAARVLRWPGGRVVLLVSCVPLLALSGAHWRWSEALASRLRNVILSEQPLREVSAIHQRLASLPGRTLLLLGRPARTSVWLAPYTALLAYPRGIVGDWAGSASIPLSAQATGSEYEGSVARIGAPDLAVVRAGVPDAVDADGTEEVGGGIARLLDLRRPRLVHVAPVQAAARERGRAPLRVGSDPSRGHLDLVFFSAREMVADLQIVGRSDAGPLSLVVQVVPGASSGRARRAALTEAPPSTLSGDSPLVARTRLTFGHGLSTVVLTSRSGSAAEIEQVLAAAPR